jgi:uncharacterized membrane protein YkoI
MKRAFLIGSAAAFYCLGLVAILLPISALARESSDTQISLPPREFSNSETAAIFQEMKVFANVPVSIRDAIAVAEKRSVGAKVVDVSFDGQVDRLAYKIKAYQDGQIWDGAIDASTGKIIGDGILTPVSNLDVKDQVELDGFRIAGIDLSDAAEIAEKYAAGKAVSAGLEQVDGKLVFLVVVVTDNSLKEVSIDPSQRQNRPRRPIVSKKVNSR